MKTQESDAACFILGNSRGQWWTGREWSYDVSTARRYDDEPDPDRQAREAAVSVQAQTGTACNVYFVPADQARAFFARAGKCVG